MASTSGHHAWGVATQEDLRRLRRPINTVTRKSRPEEPSAAVSDILTGVLGAGPFHDALSRMIQRCSEQRHDVAAMIVAIDGLRVINYECGHPAGDRILAHTLHMIRLTARSCDIVGRLDGNGIAIAMPNRTAADARRRAALIADRVRENPVHVYGRRIGLTVGIGIAEVCAVAGVRAGDLIASASAALSEARRRGPGVIACAGDTDEQGDSGSSAGACTDFKQLSRRSLELQRLLKSRQLEQIMSLLAAVDAKDSGTESHSINVALLAVQLAGALELPQAVTELISSAALLHDIGKIGIPDAILDKPGRLTPAEYDLVKEHPAIGVGILHHSPSLRALLPFILHHHEWYDGRGYPSGLAGERIPLGARIIHAADSIDAMQSARSYKRGYDLDRVLSELRRGRGTQFDPVIADVAIAHLSSSAPAPVTPWSALEHRELASAESWQAAGS